jgi:hypothetical protein
MTLKNEPGDKPTISVDVTTKLAGASDDDQRVFGKPFCQLCQLASTGFAGDADQRRSDSRAVCDLDELAGTPFGTPRNITGKLLGHRFLKC